MKTETPKFNKGLVLLCNRCKARVAKRDLVGQDFGELRVKLKAQWKKNKLWGQVRACETGCLGHCPLGASAIFVQNRTNLSDHCLAIPTTATEEEIIESIESFLDIAVK
tara:strand:+ start:1938 stop:2264 length:327 start_codon:yes stop_codon:yes gene_type:complete